MSSEMQPHQLEVNELNDLAAGPPYIDSLTDINRRWTVALQTVNDTKVTFRITKSFMSWLVVRSMD